MQFFTFALLALVGSSDANVFLVQHAPQAHVVTTEALEHVLSDEFHTLATEKSHILGEELWPLYVAMPKNEHGNLEPSTVRYALHRFFAHKLGWHVHGLGAVQTAWNESSPTSITKAFAPSYIQSVLEERVHGEGLNLQQLAVFAGTILDLIKLEAVADIARIYETKVDWTRTQSLGADELMKWYLVAYIQGDHGDGDFDNMLAELERNHVAWDDTVLFAKDLREAFEFEQQRRGNPFTQKGMLEHHIELVQEFVHHYRSFQNLECRSLKDRLVEMEYQGSGRVPLARFYEGVENWVWPFRESVAYLSNLGALDDSVPDHPMVIIPNYISGMSNCAHPSEFYSVCCLDECENLVSSVEDMVAQPTAEPARIAEIVSGLASETVEAPRNLSVAQMARLQDIAEHHGGCVPLHGRLFAQWMHHAYPRECPFPHASGSTNPLAPEQWMENGGKLEASYSELSKHRRVTWEEARADGSLLGVPALPWSASEELVAIHKHDGVRTKESEMKGTNHLRNFFLLGGLVSAALQAKSVTKTFCAGEPGGKLTQHMV